MDIIKKIQRYQLLRALLFAVAGVLILVEPRSFFNLVVYLAAGYFAILGLLNLLNAWRTKKATGSSGPEMMLGLLLLLAAVFTLLFTKLIVSMLPFFLGLLVLMIGIRQLVQELTLRKQNLSSMGWFVFSIAMIIIGAVLVFNPFRSVLVLLQIFGGILIVSAISEILSYFKLKK